MHHYQRITSSLLLTLVSFLFCSITSCQQGSALNKSATHIQIDSVDIAIINGKIIDGSGKEPFEGTVYISGDSILFIGKPDNQNFIIRQTIDARGNYITPGFIDLHAHGDPMSTPDFENFLAMGVTTICLGQDGSSANVRDLKAHLDNVEQQKLGVNIAEFVGHGTLRELAGIGTKATINEKELEAMKTILKDQLKYTFGMTTGLEYTPGLYAEKNELLALAQVVGRHDKLIMSHMRNEDDDALIASIQELSAQGKYARVHISHLKSVYGKGAKRGKEILDSIQQMRDSGIRISADVYPYTASFTGIAILFPDWSKTKEQFEIAKKNRRAELEKYIRDKVNSRNGPESTLLANKPYTGQTLAEAAAAKNKPFERFIIEDLGPQSISAAYFVMNEDLQRTIVADPMVGISSDGSKTMFHPRGYGTFAKVIEEYVVKDSLLSLEEAVRKMTSYSAGVLHLKDRGMLKKGYKADVLIFNPGKIKARADYINPHQLSEGFEKVFVNGKIVRENGQLTNERSGKVLMP